MRSRRPRNLNTAQAAEVLKMSATHVKRLIVAGILPAQTVYSSGGKKAYSLLKSDLKRYQNAPEGRRKRRRRRRRDTRTNLVPREVYPEDEPMFTLKEAAAILSVTVQRMAQIVRERAVPAVANRKGRYYLLIAQDQVTRLQRDLVRLKDRREWEWRHFRERVLMDTEHLLTRNWLTMKQTAAVLNVSEDRVYNLRKSGRLLAERNYPRKRTDPVWRFYVCDIRKLLEDPEYRKNRTEYEIGEATRCLRIWETFVQCNRNRVDDGLSYQGMPTGGW